VEGTSRPVTGGLTVLPSIWGGQITLVRHLAACRCGTSKLSIFEFQNMSREIATDSPSDALPIITSV
jgi:hypothetical protein